MLKRFRIVSQHLYNALEFHSGEVTPGAVERALRLDLVAKATVHWTTQTTLQQQQPSQ